MAKTKPKANLRIAGILYLVLVFLILAFLFFNDKGILKYLELQGRIDSLNTQIKYSEQEIKNIEAEIDSLKTDRFKIEKTAREKYNMKRENEKGLDVKLNKP